MALCHVMRFRKCLFCNKISTWDAKFADLSQISSHLVTHTVPQLIKSQLEMGYSIATTKYNQTYHLCT